MRKGEEQNGGCLIKVLSQHISGETEENDEKFNGHYRVQAGLEAVLKIKKKPSSAWNQTAVF